MTRELVNNGIEVANVTEIEFRALGTSVLCADENDRISDENTLRG
jgi:hypothetical protein